MKALGAADVSRNAGNTPYQVCSLHHDEEDGWAPSQLAGTGWRYGTDLIGILMIQIRPYLHLNIRALFSAAVVQAITDSSADQKPRIKGYDTPVSSPTSGIALRD